MACHRLHDILMAWFALFFHRAAGHDKLLDNHRGVPFAERTVYALRLSAGMLAQEAFSDGGASMAWLMPCICWRLQRAS